MVFRRRHNYGIDIFTPYVLNYRQYPLSELFVTEKGLSKSTKKYGNAHSGKYPVYSASSQKPLTYLNTFDYDGRYMT